MLAHVGANGGKVGQKACVHELVELVRADEADLQRRGDLGDVGGRRAEERDARAREGDLGGRGNAEDAVLVTRFARIVEDVRKLIGRIGEIMHGIGVVPHDAEVRGSLHGGEPAHRFVRIGDAGRVRVLGDAEHALDGIV